VARHTHTHWLSSSLPAGPCVPHNPALTGYATCVGCQVVGCVWHNVQQQQRLETLPLLHRPWCAVDTLNNWSLEASSFLTCWVLVSLACMPCSLSCQGLFRHCACDLFRHFSLTLVQPMWAGSACPPCNWRCLSTRHDAALVPVCVSPFEGSNPMLGPCHADQVGCLVWPLALYDCGWEKNLVTFQAGLCCKERQPVLTRPVACWLAGCWLCAAAAAVALGSSPLAPFSALQESHSTLGASPQSAVCCVLWLQIVPCSVDQVMPVSLENVGVIIRIGWWGSQCALAVFISRTVPQLSLCVVGRLGRL
jgi:hypothetical protein